MIPVHLISTRITNQQGMSQDIPLGATAYISPERIDTVSEVTPAARTDLPPSLHGARAVVRYMDPMVGFRLMFVQQTAKEVASLCHHYRMGADPDDPLGTGGFAG